MKRICTVFIAALVAMAFMATTLMAYPNLSQKTGKPCTYCHKKPQGGKELTDAGKYYKKNQKLPPAAKKPATKPPAKKAPAKKAPTKGAGTGKGPSTKKPSGAYK